jgi:hypothetical protein
MPNIDYSKWDNLDDCSSSSEEYGSNDATPRVTKLETPSSVTFGGEKTEVVVDAAAASKTSSSSDEKKSAARAAAGAPTTSSTKPLHNEWTDRGSQLQTEDGRTLYWSQDRYSVTIHLQLRKQERATSLNVRGILPYSDRCAAVGRQKSYLECFGNNTETKQNVTLIQGDLPHFVHLAQDDDSVDWSVVTGSEVGLTGRYLQITLHKAVPMQNMFVWWRRPLMIFKEQQVDGRYDGGGGANKTSEEFQKAWDEAHKMFRESKQSGAAAAAAAAAAFGPQPPPAM